MQLENIAVEHLKVSEHNVRKTLASENDETNLQDLANDITINGLINPLTVMKMNENEYEIIAGQRRFKALQLLNEKRIPCHIMDVDIHKAEEISLTENVQRNQMTNADKIRVYAKLYELYGKNIEKVCSVVNISKKQLSKYIQLKELDNDTIQLLDKKDDNKISLDVAVELSKLKHNPNISSFGIASQLSTMTNQQKAETIKKFNKEGYDTIEDLCNIQHDVTIAANNIKLAPSVPYVYDEITDNNIVIPPHLYSIVVKMINEKN